MENNDARNTSLCQNAARKALVCREAARVNPNPGTLSNARLKSLDFRRMMAKRRAARGRPDLRGAARAGSEAKRLRAFGAASARRDEQYNNSHAL